MNKYTVTYTVNGNTYGAVETYTYGARVSLRGYAADEGMEFTGWSSNEVALLSGANSFVMPAANVVISGSVVAMPTATPPAASPTPGPQGTPVPTPTPVPDYVIELELPPLEPLEEVIAQPMAEREVNIKGRTYAIQDNAVPLAGIGSRNVGDCPN